MFAFVVPPRSGALAQPGRPLPPAPLRPALIVGDTHPLKDVSDAVQAGDTLLLVLTSGAPAVHTFASSGVRTWGGRGQGPGEIENATAIGVRSDVVHILETSPGDSRIELFDLAGRHVRAVRFRGLGLVVRASPVSGGFVVEAGGFAQPTRSLRIVNDSGVAGDSLAGWTVPPRVALAPARGPRFGTSQPFAPVTEWAALPDGSVALWNPGDGAVTMIRNGRRTALRLPALEPLRLTTADRDAWLARRFPPGFMNMGEDPLRYVRQEAIRTLKFPEVFPAVLELRAGASGEVWAQRSPASQGEEWLILAEGRACRRLRLPVGRELLFLGPGVLIAKSVDDLGVERVERYRTADVEPHIASCLAAG